VFLLSMFGFDRGFISTRRSNELRRPEASRDSFRKPCYSNRDESVSPQKKTLLARDFDHDRTGPQVLSQEGVTLSGELAAIF